jgi:AmmeMemoRadiSam system protein B
MNDRTAVRKPAVAGMFYPGDPDELRSTIKGLLQQAKKKSHPGDLQALIVPHAGYLYSGLTAAHAYTLLSDRKIDTVALIGPSHREYFDHISIYSGAAFETPLGAVQIDQQLRDALVACSPLVRMAHEGHRAEHSLEVQIPFLQMTLSGYKILPIVMGDQSSDVCNVLSKALTKVLKGKNALIVASSDLSHFYSADVARTLDSRAIEAIRSLNSDLLLEEIDLQKTEACGGGPIIAAIGAAKQLGATDCTILHSCNSGDISGDIQSVVGYVSAAVWKNA